MGDEGMDPCECIWGHELAMRRLLNVIRNSQNTCTDNECFEDGFQSPSANSNVLLMTLFVVAALFLYFLRPRPQRLPENATKPKSSGHDQNGFPPNPPPTMN